MSFSPAAGIPSAARRITNNGVSAAQELLEEIGGLGEGYALHEWQDLLKKPDPPVEETPADG